MTVLRDGKYRGTSNVEEVTDDQLLSWIVGRQLDSTFPPKHQATADAGQYLSITGLTGDGFTDVNVSAQTGEIVGVAGVVGNGQSEFMAALAGLRKFDGERADPLASRARPRTSERGRPTCRPTATARA